MKKFTIDYAQYSTSLVKFQISNYKLLQFLVLGLLGTWTLGTYFMYNYSMFGGLSEPAIVAITFGFLILIFSVILHEVMHGYVALKFGDHTAENAGRLTLNPISHIDPIGTILFPLIGAITGTGLFGWAKPVPVNPLHFSDIKKGEIAVSAAGVVTNFALAILFALSFHLANSFYPNFLLSQILKTGVTINLILAIFNLIPIPPLDGSKVLMALLPYDLAREYMKIERFGFIILIFLIYIGVLGWIVSLVLPIFYTLLQVPFY